MRVKFVVPRRARRKKIKKYAKGFYGAQSRSTKIATQYVLRSWRHAYTGRKLRKRNLRRLWITRINAAARQYGLKYSLLMWALRQINFNIGRKMLAEISISHPEDFRKICDMAKEYIQQNDRQKQQ